MRFVCLGLATVSAVLVGCSGSSPNGAQSDASASEDGTSPTDATANDGARPSDGGVDVDGAPDGGGPTISNLVFTVSPNNVLSGVLTFTTDEPTTDQVQVTNLGDGGADNSFSVPLSGKPATMSHRIEVLGMRASSPFRFDVKTTDATSRSASASLDYTTAALPAAIPPVQVVTNDKTKTSPGYTMINLWAWDASQPFVQQDGSRSSIVVVDADGQVVWYFIGSSGAVPVDPKKLPSGDIVFLTAGQTSSWAEIDMLGNVVRSFQSTAMGLDYVSHEIFPEPGTDRYLSLAPELRRVSGYPTADGGTTTYSVVGDAVAEFDADGGLLNRWSAFDLLDPLTEGDKGAFNNPFWNFVYRDAGATKDWTHDNSVVTDPTDGTIVVSSRTLSWIYKFGRGDGGAPQLLWRLGQGGDFTLTNSNDVFQFNQHGAVVLPSGHVMAFDNGNDHPNDAGVAGLYSRAVEYSLDTTSMQATIVWQYQESPPFFSFFLGSSYLLPNGNVLVCDGGEIADRSVSYTDATNLKFGRIMEVTHDAAPSKVMEFDVNVPISWTPNFSGFSVYRAVRIASLY